MSLNKTAREKESGNILGQLNLIKANWSAGDNDESLWHNYKVFEQLFHNFLN